MDGEIAGLYVSISADLTGLDMALNNTRLRLQEMSASGGVLGVLPSQAMTDASRLVGGISAALAPLPQVLAASLHQPAIAALDAVRQAIQQRIAQITEDVLAAARGLQNLAGSLGIATSLNFAALEGRATGGPVSSGTPYLVGEAGPELFVPGVSGAIIPNHVLNSGLNISGGTFHIYGVQDAESLYDALQTVARTRGG